MKKLFPFLLALILFVSGLLTYNYYLSNSLSLNNPAIGYILSNSKNFNHNFITSNLQEETIIVFGSSELGSQISTEFHPKQIFENNELQLMLIGRGYFQSLNHAITLGSCDTDELTKKKVVLILSPQWFIPEGVNPHSVPERFSEKNYLDFIKNKNINIETRHKVNVRVKELLQSTDPTTLKRLEKYEKSFLDGSAFPCEYFYSQVFDSFLNLKYNWESVNFFEQYRKLPLQNQNILDVNAPNWESLLQNAETYGNSMCTNNNFDIDNNYYSKYIVPRFSDMENSYAEIDYSVSKEYDDLRLFLNVCKDLDVEPLLVSIPVKGKWYDYAGFSQEKRQNYYQNIRNIANEYSVTLADFSEYEYENYFLCDTSHLGWKGWVRVSESIYNFASEN